MAHPFFSIMQQRQHHQYSSQCPRDPILEDTQFSFHFSEPISTIHDSKLHVSGTEFEPTGSTPALAIGSMATESEQPRSGATGRRPPKLISRDSNSSFSHKGGVVCEEVATEYQSKPTTTS